MLCLSGRDCAEQFFRRSIGGGFGTISADIEYGQGCRWDVVQGLCGMGASAQSIQCRSRLGLVAEQQHERKVNAEISHGRMALSINHCGSISAVFHAAYSFSFAGGTNLALALDSNSEIIPRAWFRYDLVLLVTSCRFFAPEPKVDRHNTKH
jgi:hypothetical protein